MFPRNLWCILTTFALVLMTGCCHHRHCRQESCGSCGSCCNSCGSSPAAAAEPTTYKPMVAAEPVLLKPVPVYNVQPIGYGNGYQR